MVIKLGDITYSYNVSPQIPIWFLGIFMLLKVFIIIYNHIIMKQVVRLTESDLYGMIQEAITTIQYDLFGDPEIKRIRKTRKDKMTPEQKKAAKAKRDAKKKLEKEKADEEAWAKRGIIQTKLFTDDELDESISHTINNKINSMLTESIPSNTLASYFKEHGGVDRTFGNDGLGDFTDDVIQYAHAFPNEKEARNVYWNITKQNGYRGLFFTMMKAADGSVMLVGVDRNKVQTGLTWGGERTKKKADRYWNNGERNKYLDDTGTYYYGGDTGRAGINPSPVNDFGIRTNQDYKNRVGQLQQNKTAYEEQPYKDAMWAAKFSKTPKSNAKKAEQNKEALRTQGRQNYQDWRDKELGHMKDYITREWPKQAKRMGYTK